MTDPKAQDWEERFEKLFSRIDYQGNIWGENNSIHFDNNYSQLGAIKAFIAQEIADAEERGRREVIAELERQVEDGGSAEVILAAVKRNFTP